jgi:hypothetical protein
VLVRCVHGFCSWCLGAATESTMYVLVHASLKRVDVNWMSTFFYHVDMLDVG